MSQRIRNVKMIKLDMINRSKVKPFSVTSFQFTRYTRKTHAAAIEEKVFARKHSQKHTHIVFIVISLLLH